MSRAAEKARSAARKVRGAARKLVSGPLWAAERTVTLTARRRCQNRFAGRLSDAALSQVPIIINNRNRLTYLRMLLGFLERCQLGNIVILDNGSTYEPLLEFYRQCPHEIVRFERNVGPHALWDSGQYRRFRNSYYVYSDPDIVPVEECPRDFMSHLYKGLRDYGWTSRVGLGLLIDDLPEHYNNRRKVTDWESKFWQEPLAEGFYRAPVDTTFALYRPWTHYLKDLNPSVRTGRPWAARHMPWYVDSANLDEEERFYEASVKPGASWWVGENERRERLLQEKAR